MTAIFWRIAGHVGAVDGAGGGAGRALDWRCGVRVLVLAALLGACSAPHVPVPVRDLKPDYMPPELADASCDAPDLSGWLPRAPDLAVSVPVDLAEPRDLEQPLPHVRCAGDSITLGTVGSGYRGTLAALYPAIYEGPLVDASGLHHDGISGANIDTLEKDLAPRLPGFHGTLILEIGTNDINRGTPADSALQFLSLALVHFFAAFDGRILLAQITPLGIPNMSGNTEQVVLRYNAGLDEFARAFPGRLRVVNVHDAVTWPSDFAADGVHPVASGYAKIAATWAAALEGWTP